MNYSFDAYRELEDGEVLMAMGYDIIVRRRTVGPLQLSTGALVACDLIEHPETESFDLQISPGQYPVRLIIAELRDEIVIAYASVELSPQPATRWRVATVHGEDLSRFSQEPHGFAIHSDIACFMDEQVAGQLIQYNTIVPDDEHELWRDMRAQFKKMRKRHRGKTLAAWAELRHPSLGQGNIIAMSSGYGQGLYTTYAGYDRDDNLTRLVTDFGVLKLRFPTFASTTSAQSDFVPT